jgi:amino acid adenylation domain-containing protein
MSSTAEPRRCLDFLLHHYLGTAASSAPDRVAVVDGQRRMTYRELDERSSQLANLLIRSGTRQGDRVGLFLEKSVESVVGIYATLKAGAAYVPLDPAAPMARVSRIAEDARIAVLLTSDRRSDQWPLVAEESGVRAVVVVDARTASPAAGSLPEGISVSTADDIDAQPTAGPHVSTIDSDLAYILYTSGSTGNAKGVMLSHLNATTFVEWAVARFGLTGSDRFSSHAPLHFDLSVLDLFGAARAGGTLFLVPAEASVFPAQLARFIRDAELTVWYSVPSILSLMVQRGGLTHGCFPNMRVLFFAGEVFPTKYLKKLMDLLPGVRFVNMYGPTETNVCTYYEVPPLPAEADEPIPIGRAIDNVHVFSVMADGRLARAGQVGELHVRGSTVMQGYWSDPERSAKGLVADPFAPGLGHVAYRTGDLVEELADGNYRYIGRRDHQVKSRGYRIELGDVEAALYAHPGVREAAVIAEPHDLLTNVLVAFVAADPSLEQHALVQFLHERLPAYMVPTSFDFRPSLPRTSTGKLDRQALISAARFAGAASR